MDYLYNLSHFCQKTMPKFFVPSRFLSKALKLPERKQRETLLDVCNLEKIGAIPIDDSSVSPVDQILELTGGESPDTG